SCQDLIIAEHTGIARRRIGAHHRAGQPFNFLADRGNTTRQANEKDKTPNGQCQPAVNQKPEFGFGFFLRHCLSSLVCNQQFNCHRHSQSVLFPSVRFQCSPPSAMARARLFAATSSASSGSFPSVSTTTALAPACVMAAA